MSRRLFVAGGIGSLLSRPPQHRRVIVLAVDVSNSLTQAGFAMQMRGYAAAFRNRDVLAAIKSDTRPIVVCMIFWAEDDAQMVAIDWHVIRGEESAEVFARKIDVVQRPQIPNYLTSIAGALRFARRYIQTSGLQAEERIIDMSGDGKHQKPGDLAWERQLTLEAGIIINGLPIMSGLVTFATMAGLAQKADLDRYYEDNVIGGEGSFMMPVNGLRDFEKGFRRKLILEIA